MLVGCAAAVNMIAQLRRTRISGSMANHKRRVGKEWVVCLAGENHHVSMKAKNDGAKIRFADGTKVKVLTQWRPGMSLLNAKVDGQAVAIKIRPTAGGYEFRYRGATHQLQVLAPRTAQLNGFMLEKIPADTSRFLLCPMPGLIVSISVTEGEEVQEGQTLATVEAMKMESILRAERKGRVLKICAQPGDSLAVDEVIMEFEPPS